MKVTNRSISTPAQRPARDGWKRDGGTAGGPRSGMRSGASRPAGGRSWAEEMRRRDASRSEGAGPPDPHRGE